MKEFWNHFVKNIKKSYNFSKGNLILLSTISLVLFTIFIIDTEPLGSIWIYLASYFSILVFVTIFIIALVFISVVLESIAASSRMIAFTILFFMIIFLFGYSWVILKEMLLSMLKLLNQNPTDDELRLMLQFMGILVAATVPVLLTKHTIQKQTLENDKRIRVSVMPVISLPLEFLEPTVIDLATINFDVPLFTGELYLVELTVVNKGKNLVKTICIDEVSFSYEFEVDGVKNQKSVQQITMKEEYALISKSFSLNENEGLTLPFNVPALSLEEFTKENDGLKFNEYTFQIKVDFIFEDIINNKYAQSYVSKLFFRLDGKEGKDYILENTSKYATGPARYLSEENNT